MNIHTQTNKHMWVCMKQRAKTQTQTSSTITTIICQLSFVRLKQQYQTAATTVSRISAINKRIKFDYILIILCHKKYSIPNEIGSEFECHWLNISIHTFKEKEKKFLGLSVSNWCSCEYNKGKMYVGHIRMTWMCACRANAVRFIRHVCVHVYVKRRE